jgi:hypothetical protein
MGRCCLLFALAYADEREVCEDHSESEGEA